MIFAKQHSAGGSSGIAALTILKVLMEIMQKKNLLSSQEIDIILNCAEVEVDGSDLDGQVDEAKLLIRNLFKDNDGDDTTGYKTTGKHI